MQTIQKGELLSLSINRFRRVVEEGESWRRSKLYA
jgi:hypothetical protein